DIKGSHGNWMVMRDEPDHTRLRDLVSKAFTPGTVSGLRTKAQIIVDQLLNAMERSERADLIADYAFLLPVTLIAAMLGVPQNDHGEFKSWSTGLTAASDVKQTPERLEVANTATRELTEY